ncbi:MAG TPA: ParA family protein [Spirochaetota bacterium]|nr:ParA family protein [Spirochaetota bacterium]
MSKKNQYVIAVVNQKGGCGKTTMVQNLAGAMAFNGKKVLCIDLDPQANLSKSFNWQTDNRVKNLYAGLECSPVQTDIKNIEIIPADKGLSSLLSMIVSDFSVQFMLKDYLEKITGYDLVLLDTPPAIGGFSFSAVLAADYFLVPVSTNYFTTQGTNDLLAGMNKVRQRLNKELKFLGACISIHDRRNALANEILESTASTFNPNFFNAVIHKAVRVEEAQVNKKPVVEMFPGSVTAKEYVCLAGEITERVGL